MEAIGSQNELTAKQSAAICALLSQPTIEKAAKAAKVGETTLHRWLSLPSFSAALKDARSRAIESTLTSLQAASGQAVETLRSVMADDEAQASAKVSAARTVLEMTLRARDQLDTEERLKAIEQRLLALNGQGPQS
jgi:hypothetical protein